MRTAEKRTAGVTGRSEKLAGGFWWLPAAAGVRGGAATGPLLAVVVEGEGGAAGVLALGTGAHGSGRDDVSRPGDGARDGVVLLRLTQGAAGERRHLAAVAAVIQAVVRVAALEGLGRQVDGGFAFRAPALVG